MSRAGLGLGLGGTLVGCFLSCGLHMDYLESMGEGKVKVIFVCTHVKQIWNKFHVTAMLITV